MHGVSLEVDELQVPDHSPITRRQQFKVKSTIKEEKLAKKGRGKGGEPKGKGKGRGKGKGKTSKQKDGKGKGKGGRKAKQQAAHGPNRRRTLMKLTSKKSLLGKLAAKKSKQEEESETKQTSCQHVPALNKQNECATEPPPKKQKAAVKQPKVEKPKTPKAKQQGRSAKDKAAEQAKPKSKAKAKGWKTTGNAKPMPTREEMLEIAEETLQGNFNFRHGDMEVDASHVHEPLKDMFTGLLAECQQQSKCDGSCHHFHYMQKCEALRLDLYWSRSAFGVRVLKSMIGMDRGDSKSPLTSAAYFASGSCTAINFAAMNIYVAWLRISNHTRGYNCWKKNIIWKPAGSWQSYIIQLCSSICYIRI